jgi:hypothetical protein
VWTFATRAPPDKKPRDFARPSRAAWQRAQTSVGASGDRAEQEADRVAHQFTHAPSASGARSSPGRAPEVAQATGAAHGGGAPLPETARAFFERRFGFDFSSVRIHDDAGAHALAGQTRSQALTIGSDVYFGADRYAPHTDAGRHLLAHELTHVAQQRAAAEPALQRKADAAAVASKTPAQIEADPDYIDNGIVRMQFFSAESAILHYADGTALTIGLIPRWIKPPLEQVDYRSSIGEYPVLPGGAKELRLLPHPHDIPAAERKLPFEEVAKKHAVSVRFTVDTSGKIIPNLLNVRTAPRLCALLREAEAEFIKLSDEVSKGGVKVFEKMKTIIELELLRASLGGPRSLTPKPITAGERAVERSLAKILADPNKLHHIFDKAGRGLAPVLERVGGQEELIRQVLTKLLDVVPESGVFEKVVEIAGTRLTIRGAVVDGVMRIGTVFLAP